MSSHVTKEILTSCRAFFSGLARKRRLRRELPRVRSRSTRGRIDGCISSNVRSPRRIGGSREALGSSPCRRGRTDRHRWCRRELGGSPGCARPGPNGLPGLKRVADDQLLKFTQDGKFVRQLGHSNQSKGNADTENVHRAADMWAYPQTNELFVADGYGNHRVAVFNADTGAFKRMWGAFANKPVDDDHCEVVTPKSFPEGPGPQNFSIVHAIRVATDGMVYVADRENRRVQTFATDGKFVKQLVKTDTPFARDLALSPDREQQFLYVGNGADIVVVDRKSLEPVGSIKVPDMIGGGHQIATDSKGNIYIAQTTAGLQKLAYKGMSPAR